MKMKSIVAAMIIAAVPAVSQANVVDFSFSGNFSDGTDNVNGSPFTVKFSWDTDRSPNFTSDYGYGDGKIYMADWWGPQGGSDGPFTSPITITDALGEHIYDGGSLLVYYHGGYHSPLQRTTYIIRSNASRAYLNDYAEITFGDMTETDFDGKMPSSLPISGNAWLNVDESRHGNGAIVAVVPEPATWTLMLAGFGLTGATLRRRRPALASA